MPTDTTLSQALRGELALISSRLEISVTEEILCGLDDWQCAEKWPDSRWKNILRGDDMCGL